jgi:hypothetical protein
MDAHDIDRVSDSTRQSFVEDTGGRSAKKASTKFEVSLYEGFSLDIFLLTHRVNLD